MESKKRNEIDELGNLCKNICFLRKKNNLTKREMARLLGISVYSLIRIEKGKVPKKLSCKVLFYAAKNFSVEISQLFRTPEKGEKSTN